MRNWLNDNWVPLIVFLGLVALSTMLIYHIYTTENKRAFLKEHCAFNRTKIETTICTSTGVGSDGKVVVFTTPCTVTLECYVCDGGEECL